ncbi:MAG: cupin [Flavobacteriales bacterium]|nr:cupin [Flavobacteriales bacterium]
MKTSSLRNDLTYNEDKVSIHVMMETDVSKEIRILLKKGQEMKAHKAGFPITIEIHSGAINFGVNDDEMNLVTGDLIYLDANVPHSLLAKEDSIVRLTLSTFDSADRVKEVAKQS